MTPEEQEDNDQRFEPNYYIRCDTCRQKPTVNNYKLCGACFFGEADCIDPQNW